MMGLFGKRVGTRGQFDASSDANWMSHWIMRRDLREHFEVLRGPEQLLAGARVARVMTSVVDDHKLGARPSALELPRVRDRRLKVEASVHQDSGDVRECVGAAEQDPVTSHALCRT